MIFFFFLYQFSISAGYFAIDFGSYFCKMGNVSLMGYPQIITNRQTKRLTPTFLAFRPNGKFDSKSTGPLTKEEVMSLEHEIGVNAIDILQKRPWAGSGFFPAFIDATPNYAEQLSKRLFISNPHNSTRFGFYNLTSSFIHFYIENVYSHIPDSKWHLQVVVPNFYTIPQQHFISSACKTAGIKNVSIITDTAAIAYYYAHMKSHLFQKEPKAYLFVDVGATSVKSYLMGFSMAQKDQILIQRISYVYNDNTGGAYATARLAEYLKKQIKEKNINLVSDVNLFEIAEKAKCQLTLSNDVQVNIDVEEGKAFSINITRKIFEELIVDFIIETVNVALKAAGQYKIDRVEIIGGSSRIPKLQQSLMKALNVKRLGKSLNADEVLTLGALYSQIKLEDEKVILFKDLTIRPSIAAKYDGDMTIVCNSSSCINLLLLKNQPTSFSLIYSNKTFNKHLRTRKWTYKWKSSNSSNPNIVYFNLFNADVNKVGEVVGNKNKTKQDSKQKELHLTDLELNFNFSVDYVKPNDWMTNFVDILSNQYISQKTSAELINAIEELYYSMIQNGEILPFYSNSFNSEDIQKLEKMLNEIKLSIVDRVTNLPEERIKPLLQELSDYKYRALKAKNINDEFVKLQELIAKLTKYTQKPFNTRHPDLGLFLTGVVTDLHKWQEEFADEKKKNKELQNFDIEKVQKANELVQSKLKDALQIEKQFLESNPLIEIICLMRIKLIRFINRNLWFFRIFEKIK